MKLKPIFVSLFATISVYGLVMILVFYYYTNRERLTEENNAIQKEGLKIETTTWSTNGDRQTAQFEINLDNVNMTAEFTCPATKRLISVKSFGEKYNLDDIIQHPNIPRFILENENLSNYVPQIHQLRWSSVFQESWKVEPKFFLYSASFDARSNSTLVRLLTLRSGKYVGDLFCQLYYDVLSAPVLTPIIETHRQFYKSTSSFLKSVMLSCKAPLLNGSFPIGVSLVKDFCGIPTNILRISGSPKQVTQARTNFKVGVCGKALYYYNTDFSLRLIEWIKMMTLLGVSKILFYKIHVHENVDKVLEYYKKEGIVEIIRFAYPPPYAQEATLIRTWAYNSKSAFVSAQSIYLNDCLLRYKDEFDYLAVFDPDEVPVLRMHQNLQEFLLFMRNRTKYRGNGFSIRWKTQIYSGPSSISFNNRNFSSFIFSHTLRNMSFGEENVKTIYDTQRVLWVGCHRPLSMNLRTPPFRHRPLPIYNSNAYLAHFSLDGLKKIKKITSIEYNATGGRPILTTQGGKRLILAEEKALMKFRDEILRELAVVASQLEI